MNCVGRMQDSIYNCFGNIDNSLCYDCRFNADSESKEKQNRFVSYKDRFQVLYDYLRGEKLPDGVHCKMPKLSDNVAFSVIWFLQEVMNCLPSNIEQCQRCKQLFDANSEGYYLDDQYELNGRTLPKKYWGHWCDCCVPDVEFGLK